MNEHSTDMGMGGECLSPIKVTRDDPEVVKTREAVAPQNIASLTEYQRKGIRLQTNTVWIKH